MKRSSSLYDFGASLTSPEARAIFIADALATGNAAHTIAAIGVAIRAFGVNEMSSRAGIPVIELDQRFSTEANPDFFCVLKVLQVLGVSLSVSLLEDAGKVSAC